MNIALKEWAVVIEALARGRQHFLLRKGGIAEGRRGFEVSHDEFLLYPTWEHQQIDSIRPGFHELFDQARPRRQGAVAFRYLAKVTDVLLAPARLEDMAALEESHIWAPRYLEMRYGYKPERPLFVLVLRLYRLAAAREIPEISRYAGCRSWVELDQEIDTAQAAPIESDASFDKSRKLLLDKLLKEGAETRAVRSTTP